MIDPRLLLICPEDNCLIVQPLAAGAEVMLEQGDATVRAPLGLGHKLARHAMPKGEKILKYGAVIGSLTQPSRPGTTSIRTTSTATTRRPTRWKRAIAIE